MESTAKAKANANARTGFCMFYFHCVLRFLTGAGCNFSRSSAPKLPNLVGRDFLARMTGSGACETEILRTVRRIRRTSASVRKRRLPAWHAVGPLTGLRQEDTRRETWLL